MTDAKSLHDEAVRLRRKMQAKLNDADKSTLRAESYSKAGDFHKAAIHGDIANKDYRDALIIEREAVEFDRKAADLENKAHEIEKEEDEMKRSGNSALLKELEKIKNKLRGYYK